VLSLLSGRQIIIKNIRSSDENPGLKDYEMSLLKLIEKVTNGSVVNINKTGTRLIFRPGMIDCNEGMPIEHECHLERNITYYLEVVVPLGVFGKTILNLNLKGNTDDNIDQSIDSFKSAWGHMLKMFGAEGSLDIKVTKRGYAPLGGGQVELIQRFAKKLDSVSLVDEGKIKRIRGLLTSAKVSPQLTTRVVDKVREVLNDYIPDVWIHTDHYKKGLAGDQPGYALSLVAETTTGMLLTKDYNFNSRDFKLPEDLGKRVALALLDEIFSGSAVDSANQPFALLMMSLGAADNISQIKIGRITQQSVEMLKNIKKFLNVQFKIEEVEDDVYSESSEGEEEEKEGEEDSEEGEEGYKRKEEEEVEKKGAEFPKSFIFSCIGIGLTNIARKTE
jgi:RNA 3'-terminal phosphate cyclase-like protein